MTGRKCKACSRELPLESFHTVTTRGVVYYRWVCRGCVAVENNRKYDVNENGVADRKRAFTAAHNSKNPKDHYKRNVDYWRRHPQKAACTKAVFDAVKSGALKRLPCVKCGSEKSQAHHEDYSKPLDVIWYCQRHHGERHREINRSQTQRTTL